MSSKFKNTATAFGIFFLLLGLGATKVQAHPDRGITLQTFYDELSNYGDWINNPDYGYVWRPNVGSDFRPYYTNGHWLMTEYGNTWASDYDWGWAPFHYGRWFYDDYDGWIWEPDTEWGPAWVSWRSGGGYYGWAPLAPRISININFGRRYYIPDDYWVFIPQRCIYYPSYGNYWEPRRNVYIIHNTTYINNVYVNNNVRFFSGPREDEIRRATNQNVRVYRINDNDRPGSTRVDRGAVNIYRPEVRKDGNASAPRTVANNSPRPSRSGDNGMGGNNNSDGRYNGNPNTQRPDGGAFNGNTRTDNQPNDRVGLDNRSQRPDAGNGQGNNGRPVRNDNSNPTGTDQGRSNQPVRQEPRVNQNTRPERSEMPTRVERPAPAERQDNRNEGRPQRVENTQTAPRTESNNQRGESRSGDNGGRPSRGGDGRPSNRGN